MHARTVCKEVFLTDPADGAQIPALSIETPDGVALTAIPDRALDLYNLHFKGQALSHTKAGAFLSPRHFTEDGAAGFSKNFFVGMMTTCGLIQAGRPCEEGGRSFGLHGCISNTSAESVHIHDEDDALRVHAVMHERHPEGEHMRLERTLSVFHQGGRIELHDRITNLGETETPYMIMYHVNFGAPFLSPDLHISGSFFSAENRDTGLPAADEEMLTVCPRGAWEKEKVFYTRPDWAQGFLLENPRLGVRVHLTAKGDGLDYGGVWLNYVDDPYALGLEPCVCPGLGRAGARARGLLPILAPGQSRENTVSWQISSL